MATIRNTTTGETFEVGDKVAAVMTVGTDFEKVEPKAKAKAAKATEDTSTEDPDGQSASTDDGSGGDGLGDDGVPGDQPAVPGNGGSGTPGPSSSPRRRHRKAT
jgi:hypothetical protein